MSAEMKHDLFLGFVVPSSVKFLLPISDLGSLTCLFYEIPFENFIISNKYYYY